MEQLNSCAKDGMDSRFFNLLWAFTIFSFLGTMSEGFYWVIRYGHFALRVGLIYGPFSEIYGLAAIIMVLLLNRYSHKSFLFLFVASFVISSGFEFFCSLIQQWVFGFTSWDYGASKLALFGRANLLFAVPWGVFGALLIKNIYPWFTSAMHRIPKKSGAIVSWLLLLFMVFNIVVSAAAVYRYDQRQNHIPATNIIQQELDRHYTDLFLEKRFARLSKGRL